MKRTLAEHFGGMRNVPLPALALVADSDAFRVNNLTLQTWLKKSLVSTVWARALIMSRFSNSDLYEKAMDRYFAICRELSAFENHIPILEKYDPLGLIRSAKMLFGLE